MTSPIHLLRLLIQTGDLDTPAARRLALDVGNLLPPTAAGEALRIELQDAIETVRLAEIIGAPADGAERREALRVLDAIEAAARWQGGRRAPARAGDMG